ncbi:hypothetical protein PGT21_035669 [Puccinia graminis f. sp. tritici]|uniref:Secreted protein n=1 Tax=Puccinia graminis f. sp. tritici TaxID=56615 RepID=A0A5B0N6D0_PUCGR|nr:hypothetical protein PGTUg99_027466 [Puccinia graminis f. sp. tritici]KAA1084811.1 hypothetical protein PGT21_035669 [Puccinia graminis f. sp. tritici]
MFYQLMVVVLCAVQVIISPNSGNPLAEDFSKFHQDSLNRDGTFPGPDIVTVQDNSEKRFLKQSPDEILETGPSFQIRNDNNLSKKPPLFAAAIENLMSDCEKELSGNNYWEATKEKFKYLDNESKKLENHAKFIFLKLGSPLISPEEIPEQHLKDTKSIADFQTKIEILKILKLRELALANTKVEESIAQNFPSDKDYLAQLPNCPKWVSPKTISLTGQETLQGFCDSLVNKIKDIILDCKSEVAGFKEKGNDYDIEEERFIFPYLWKLIDLLFKNHFINQEHLGSIFQKEESHWLW